MKNKAPLIIFDWDGTLCDSQARIVQCMQRAALAAGVDVLEEKTIQNVIGLGLSECIHHLYPQLDQEQSEHLKKHYIEYFLEADQTPSPLFEGVEEGLQQLRSAGFLMAVATGKSRRGLDRILSYHDFNDLFIATRCADETRSKPDPLMLQQLLEVTGISPHQAIMVGDTEYDMAMAQAIEMPAIGVSFGVHDIERLQAYPLETCIDHFSELPGWIKQNLSINLKINH